MRVPRIYTAQPLSAESELTLEAGPAQHVGRVLRMGPGDHLVLFNGQGGEYRAAITAIEKKSVRVAVGEHLPRESESELHIHLGIALSRGERMDWIMQKATELGVQEVTPLFTERTEVKLNGERAEKKRAHWQQVAISSCEQCGRNRPPQINPVRYIDDWAGGVDATYKLVLHHRAAQPGNNSKPDSVALLVGPEGGLSDAEIQLAEAAGFLSLALGPRVLRTETAPLAAIAILQSHWGDMSF